MPDTIYQALNIAAVGLTAVFAVLTLLAGVVTLLRRWDDASAASSPQAAPAAIADTRTIDDTTLVLITAAVTTVVQGRFHIKRIRRLPAAERQGAWSQQGRAVLLGSHVIQKNGRHS